MKNLKTFLSLICLLALALAGIRFFIRGSNQPETISVAETQAPSEPAPATPLEVVSAQPPQVHREAPKAKLINEANVQPAIKETAITNPDNIEDADEIREWARQNPDAALAWALNAPAGTKLDTVAEIVCAQQAQSDPARAFALAERFSSAGSVLQENMMQQWAAKDEPASYAYANTKPAGEPRDHLFSRIAFILSRENPGDAAKIVTEQIPAGAIQDEAAISVLHQWALRDTAAAGAWAKMFPEGALRDRAIKEVENITAMTAQAEKAAARGDFFDGPVY
jgi:hypothetical protein